jgi:hypothetical protein
MLILKRFKTLTHLTLLEQYNHKILIEPENLWPSFITNLRFRVVAFLPFYQSLETLHLKFSHRVSLDLSPLQTLRLRKVSLSLASFAVDPLIPLRIEVTPLRFCPLEALELDYIFATGLQHLSPLSTFQSLSICNMDRLEELFEDEHQFPSVTLLVVKGSELFEANWEWVNRFPRLTALRIELPYLSTTLFEQLRSCSVKNLSLIHSGGLWIRKVCFTDFVPFHLEDLHLSHLWMIDLVGLGLFTSLIHLNLSCTSFVLPRLQSLILLGNHLQNSFFSSFPVLPSLKTLNLSKNCFSNKILNVLTSSCPSLTVLNPACTNINGKGLRFLALLPLQEVFLSDIYIKRKDIMRFHRKSLCTLILPDISPRMQSHRKEIRLKYRVELRGTCLSSRVQDCRV